MSRALNLVGTRREVSLGRILGLGLYVLSLLRDVRCLQLLPRRVAGVSKITLNHHEVILNHFISKCHLKCPKSLGPLALLLVVTRSLKDS